MNILKFTKCRLITTIIFTVSLTLSTSNGFSDVLSSKNNFQMKDGRVVFAKQEDLTIKVRELKQMSKQTLEQTLKSLYQKGFRSVSPIYQDTDFSLRQEFAIKMLTPSSKLTQQSVNDIDAEIDNEDPLIADDHFAALLNEGREIQVGDKIYKYTEHGIYVAKLSNLANMYAYIVANQNNHEKRSYSQENMYGCSTQPSQDDNAVPLSRIDLPGGVERYIEGDCSSNTHSSNRLSSSNSVPLSKNNIVNSNLSIANVNKLMPLIRDCKQRQEASVLSRKQLIPIDGCGSGSGSGSGSGGSNNSNHEYYDKLVKQYLDNVGYCNAGNATIPWFGTTKICISKFNGKHRVKTKFWNQNYLVYRSIGINVKNQRKKLGIWWTRSTDEMRLGVNQIYFEYKIPVPDYQTIMPAVTYLHKNRVYNQSGTYISDFNFNGSTIPRMPFTLSNVDTVEIFINLPSFFNWFGVDDINERIDANKLNKVLWKNLWSKAESIARRNGQQRLDSVLITGVGPQTAVISYMDRRYRKLRSKKIEKIFDQQVGFGVKFGVGNDSNFDFTGFTIPKLYKYDNVKIDIFGIARSGSTWRGSKLKYED